MADNRHCIIFYLLSVIHSGGGYRVVNTREWKLIQKISKTKSYLRECGDKKSNLKYLLECTCLSEKWCRAKLVQYTGQNIVCWESKEKTGRIPTM